MERGFQWLAKGIDVDTLSRCVDEMFDVEPGQVLTAEPYPRVVQARSVLCYWAVRELGITTIDLAVRVGVSRPVISTSVKRGEKSVREKGLNINSILK